LSAAAWGWQGICRAWHVCRHLDSESIADVPKYASFRLLPFFAVASLIGIVAAAILVALLYRQTAIAALVDLGERQNVALAQTALNSVREQLVAYLHRRDDGHVTDSDVNALAAAFDAVLHNTGVARIKVYNRHGEVVFSTKRSQVGLQQHDNPAFVSALQGQLTSKLIYHDTFNYFDQVTEDDNLIQTYLPVGSALGVFEIYTDVNPLVRDISRMELLIVTGTGLVFAVLYGLLLSVVRRAGTIIAHQQITIAERNSTLEKLSLRLLDAQEGERKQVAFELHEGIAQTLAAIKFRLEHAAQPSPEGQAPCADAIGGLVKEVQEAIQEVRSMATQLRPASLDDLGLGVTLGGLSRQLSSIYQDVPVEAQIDVREEAIPRPLRVIVYRTAQEALAAMTRLDGPRTIRVALREAGGILSLTIIDPALPSAQPLGADLSMVRERTLMSGGTFTQEAGPGGGSALHAEWTLDTQ